MLCTGSSAAYLLDPFGSSQAVTQRLCPHLHSIILLNVSTTITAENFQSICQLTQLTRLDIRAADKTKQAVPGQPALSNRPMGVEAVTQHVTQLQALATLIVHSCNSTLSVCWQLTQLTLLSHVSIRPVDACLSLQNGLAALRHLNLKSVEKTRSLLVQSMPGVRSMRVSDFPWQSIVEIAPG